MLDTPCVIFAGGKSSRMGEDKSLLPFGGFATLTEFQLHRFSKIFSNVHISCKSRDKFSFEASFIEDAKSSTTFAPTAGFVGVLHAMACERFFAISVDAPFVDNSIIEALFDADTSDADATIARSPHGMEPLCGIYHRSLLGEFEKMLKEDNHKLGMLLKNAKTTFVSFDDAKPFANLNHPEEYQEALKQF
jgi:molybdopterin-guanine dinucleotide biosynthesis protein A